MACCAASVVQHVGAALCVAVRATDARNLRLAPASRWPGRAPAAADGPAVARGAAPPPPSGLPLRPQSAKQSCGDYPGVPHIAGGSSREGGLVQQIPGGPVVGLAEHVPDSGHQVADDGFDLVRRCAGSRHGPDAVLLEHGLRQVAVHLR